MMDVAIIHLCKPIECIPPRINLKANYRLWVIIIHRNRFILGNGCTSLVSDGDGGGGQACGWAEGICESSVSSQFCCVPKTAISKQWFQKHRDLRKP